MNKVKIWRFGRSFAEIAEPGKKGQSVTVAREECNKYDVTGAP